jgi:hypothetical protein
MSTAADPRFCNSTQSRPTTEAVPPHTFNEPLSLTSFTTTAPLKATLRENENKHWIQI